MGKACDREAARVSPGCGLVWAALALVIAALVPAPAHGKGNAFRQTAHGDPARGVMRVPGARPGQCIHCHGRPKDARPGDGRGHMGLFLPNDNGLCLECHRTPPRSARTWLGPQVYDESAHARDRAMAWPGLARTRSAGDSGKCINCHDPHGTRDDAGVVPSMLRARGAALCLACHDGDPGRDIASALSRSYRHPMTGAAPGAPRPLEVARAAEETCSACHNPHAAGASRVGSDAAPVSSALAGVARVRLATGGALGAPVTAPASSTDLTGVREYEVCFRCHAVNVGGTGVARDVASRLAATGASFHPVVARSRGAPVDPETLVAPWRPGRLVACSDCHSSDAGLARGPHGSSYPHIVKKPYEAGPARRPQSSADLCFDCHRYDVYGAATTAVRAPSRFPGHASHSALGLSCWNCHDAHGSRELPSLLALRSPGLVSYTRDVSGGMCLTSCHTSTPSSVPYAKVRRR